jgi:hypothetical protein
MTELLALVQRPKNWRLYHENTVNMYGTNLVRSPLDYNLWHLAFRISTGHRLPWLKMFSFFFRSCRQILGHLINIVTCTGVCVTYNNSSRWDDWIYWPFFIKSLLITSHTALSLIYTFQFTVAHALGFSITRCLVADPNTGTITSKHYEVFLSFLLPSPLNADPILQF